MCCRVLYISRSWLATATLCDIFLCNVVSAYIAIPLLPDHFPLRPDCCNQPLLPLNPCAPKFCVVAVVVIAVFLDTSPFDTKATIEELSKPYEILLPDKFANIWVEQN